MFQRVSPSTDPWGTPLLLFLDLLFSSNRISLFDRMSIWDFLYFSFERYEAVRVSSIPLISISSRISCQKALLKAFYTSIVIMAHRACVNRCFPGNLFDLADGIYSLSTLPEDVLPWWESVLLTDTLHLLEHRGRVGVFPFTFWYYYKQIASFIFFVKIPEIFLKNDHFTYAPAAIWLYPMILTSN